MSSDSRSIDVITDMIHNDEVKRVKNIERENRRIDELNKITLLKDSIKSDTETTEKSTMEYVLGLSMVRNIIFYAICMLVGYILYKLFMIYLIPYIQPKYSNSGDDMYIKNRRCILQFLMNKNYKYLYSIIDPEESEELINILLLIYSNKNNAEIHSVQLKRMFNTILMELDDKKGTQYINFCKLAIRIILYTQLQSLISTIDTMESVNFYAEKINITRKEIDELSTYLKHVESPQFSVEEYFSSKYF